MIIPITDIKPNTIEEHQKSQELRLYDVIILAPFLLFIANKRTALTPWQRYAMFAAGIGTLVYNGRNYLRNRDR